MSPSQRRIWGGAKAFWNGSRFEEIFEQSCKVTGVICTPIPDGCKVVGRGKLIRVHTPFDYVLSLGNQVALVDTKTVAGDRFLPSQIKEHQVLAMAEHNGIATGYVVYFRKRDIVCWIHTRQLLEIRSQKKGISADETVSLGTILQFDPKKIFSESTSN